MTMRSMSSRVLLPKKAVRPLHQSLTMTKMKRTRETTKNRRRRDQNCLRKQSPREMQQAMIWMMMMMTRARRDQGPAPQQNLLVNLVQHATGMAHGACKLSLCCVLLAEQTHSICSRSLGLPSYVLSFPCQYSHDDKPSQGKRVVCLSPSVLIALLFCSFDLQLGLQVSDRFVSSSSCYQPSQNKPPSWPNSNRPVNLLRPILHHHHLHHLQPHPTPSPLLLLPPLHTHPRRNHPLPLMFPPSNPNQSHLLLSLLLLLRKGLTGRWSPRSLDRLPIQRSCCITQTEPTCHRIY